MPLKKEKDPDAQFNNRVRKLLEDQGGDGYEPKPSEELQIDLSKGGSKTRAINRALAEKRLAEAAPEGRAMAELVLDEARKKPKNNDPDPVGDLEKSVRREFRVLRDDLEFRFKTLRDELDVKLALKADKPLLGEST